MFPTPTTRAVCILLTGVIFGVLLPSPDAFAGESVFVEVQSAKLRSAPKVWAPAVSDLKYGDKVDVVAQEDPWIRARTPDKKEGYLHLTAVTSRQVILKGAGTQNTAVDLSDAVLAGKGFNAEVAKRFVDANLAGGFERVDQMQKQSRIGESTLLVFLRDGDLNGGETR